MFFKWKSIFEGKRLSDDIRIGKELISPAKTVAWVDKIRTDAPLCTTVVMKGHTFDIEIRGATTFDEIFAGWKWVD